MLADIVYALQKAQEGKLSLHEQRALDRECRGIPLTQEEQFTYRILQSTVEAIPQWSDEEAAKAESQENGGCLLFCHYFVEHDSMAEIAQDCNGKFDVSYVLDADISPEERKAAAQKVQQLLSEKMQAWGVALIQNPIFEQMKYPSLQLAASFLMQVLNDPESITG